MLRLLSVCNCLHSSCNCPSPPLSACFSVFLFQSLPSSICLALALPTPLLLLQNASIPSIPAFSQPLILNLYLLQLFHLSFTSCPFPITLLAKYTPTPLFSEPVLYLTISSSLFPYLPLFHPLSFRISHYFILSLSVSPTISSSLFPYLPLFHISL